ncbi:Bifunctional sulfatase/alpha-L-rhamnosidase [Paraconexibacter sp. AEG42_29]|uniref:Bifunctional sulfatase/alpha-L-rhamnosidase n=1 Tax=Paraconexibacter sp. AEG42_29 TaxID=2997339 RepID=A0AAU7AUS3_9ACTN
MTPLDRRGFLAGAGAAGIALGAGLAGPGSRGGAADADAAVVPGRRPNILILMTDQERHQDRLPDHLPTPFRCWMDQNGTRIDRFHASSMACSPSRACFWTGMYAPQQGIYGTFVLGTQFTMDPSIPTIGDLFKEVGYRTAFFGKWHLSFPGEPPTNLEAALDLAQGNPLKGYGFDDSVISPPADVGGYNDGYLNDPVWTGQAKTWLRAHAKDEQPWLCVVSLLNPHDIQFYPRGFRVDYKRPDYDAPLNPSFAAEPTLADKPSSQSKFRDVAAVVAGTPKAVIDDPEYWRGHQNTYYDLIVGTDEMLAAVVKEVIDQGALEDTVIVRTSDHGELGGAHRLQNKGTTMYDEQNRIPFTVVYPKRFPRGRRSQALGEAVDLTPTLLEIAGQPDPVGRWPWLRGVSLAGCLADPDARGPRDSVLFRTDEYPIYNTGNAIPTNSHVRAVYDGRYKYARYVAVADQHFAGRELVASQEYEMYDTWNDPYEIRNLANDPGYSALRKDLHAYLLEREAANFGPVVVPAYGPRAPITALPEPPSANLTSNGLPNPWVGAQPGSYVVVPFEQPTPAAFLYEGGLPSLIGGPPGTAGRVDMARYFCELMP